MGLSLLLLAAVPLALIGLHFRSRFSIVQHRAWMTALGAANIVAIVQLGTIALRNVWTVPPWDFLGFWLNAQVAAARHNIYDPSFARALVEPFAISDIFRREIIDVGFWYPPPSIFVFLPLAPFHNLHVAYAVWYVIQTAAAVAAIASLARTFLRDDGLAGVLVVGILVLALPAAADTFMYGQTNFLLLLFIALFWRAKNSVAGGAWLGAALLVKPFVAALGLALLVRRRFAPLGGALIVIVTASAGAIVVLGASTIRAYLSAGPYEKLPAWVYTESTNQSLLGVVLRVTHMAPSGNIHFPVVYFLVAFALVLVTAWISASSETSAADLVLSLCLLLGLLIYPASQNFYALVFVVPMLVMWQQRQMLPWRTTSAVLLIVSLYAIMRLRNEAFVTCVYALAWLVFAALTVPAIAGARFGLILQRIGVERSFVAIFALIAALLVGHDVARPGAPLLAPVGLDFRAFYCSGFAVNRGANPYRVEPLRSCEHRNQPAEGWPNTLVVPSPLPGYVAAFFSLLARLPYAFAKDVWYLLLLASLLVSTIVLRRLCGLPLVTVFLSLIFMDWWVPYHFGQLPPIAVAALSCAAACVTAKKYRIAAVAVSLTMIEPHIGLPACLAMFVWLPQTRLAIAACGVLLLGVSLVSVGPELSAAYLTQILPEHAASELVANDQFSLSHLAHIAGLPDVLALSLGTLSYIAMTLVGVLLARRLASSMQTVAFIVLLPPAIALLGGPFLHDLQFAAAIPACLLLAAKSRQLRPAAWTALALFALPWYSLAHGRFISLVEGVLALVAISTFAYQALRDVPYGLPRLTIGARFLAIFVALFVLNAVPRAHVTGVPMPLPRAVLVPEADASANWAAYLLADPELNTPSLQAELKKLPFWLAVVLLIAVASQRTRIDRTEITLPESRKPSSNPRAVQAESV